MTALCVLVRLPPFRRQVGSTSVSSSSLPLHQVVSASREGAFERLERHDAKVSRADLRGLGRSNAPRLPGSDLFANFQCTHQEFFRHSLSNGFLSGKYRQPYDLSRNLPPFYEARPGDDSLRQPYGLSSALYWFTAHSAPAHIILEKTTPLTYAWRKSRFGFGVISRL